MKHLTFTKKLFSFLKCPVYNVHWSVFCQLGFLPLLRLFCCHYVWMKQMHPLWLAKVTMHNQGFVLTLLHLINRYLSQSTVHATHGFVVQTLGAVHHNDIIAKCFAKIFHSFSLACTSRALGTTTAVEMKSSRQCHVTSVRCNHRWRFKCNALQLHTK